MFPVEAALKNKPEIVPGIGNCARVYLISYIGILPAWYWMSPCQGDVFFCIFMRENPIELSSNILFQPLNVGLN